MIKSKNISIHSLRAEGDNGKEKNTSEKSISIHSLRAEGDHDAQYWGVPQRHFNPLPPCGGRLREDIPRTIFLVFQSTPSVRRETAQKSSSRSTMLFQSTPSVRRETLSDLLSDLLSTFQSTPSVRRETSSISAFNSS